jgi:radical SAM superfamily enzyme YgiQ (UPF0313 family)
MKLLLATAPVSFAERYGKLAGAGSTTPALGLLVLAATARAHGHDCRVLEAAALDLDVDAAIARLADAPPEVLGLSATTLAIGAAQAFAAAVKARFPQVTTVLGGPHVSAVPEETLRRTPAIDIAVVGAGEETLVELLATLQQGGDLASVRGLVFRHGDQLIKTPPRAPLRDLDSLPQPAWDLLDGFPQRYAPAPFKVRHLPAASLVSSRGCPNECIFCDRSVFGATCHAHSAAYVATQMRALHRDYGVREFCFEDDTFVTFRKRLRELCHDLIENGPRFSWNCLGRVDHVTPDDLKLMRRAGCWQISYGIESGNQAILDTIGKRVTLAQIRDAVRWTREAGIKAKGFFIVGHPGETRETLHETIDFALELPLNDLSVTLLTPFPGTELYERAAEFGSFTADWGQLNLLTPVFVPFGLTADDLVQAQHELNRRFYLRPRVFADYAGRALRQPRMTWALAKGFGAFLKTVDRKSEIGNRKS